MNIKEKKKKEKVFGDLVIGEVFRLPAGPTMMMKTASPQNSPFNFVRLYDGIPGEIGFNAPVILVNGSFVEE